MNPGWRPDFADTPAFAHLRPWSRELAGEDWPSLDALNLLARARGLVNARGLPIRFVPQTRRCGQRAYENGILATGEVPTRQRNWHDLLNALTWLALPHTKQALNAVQCRALEHGTGQRGPLSDATTLFDESGLLLAGPDPGLAEDLRQRHWQRACVERRRDWQALQVLCIGHAVLEKLLQPWPGITAKCAFLALPGPLDPQALDQALARFWLAGAVTCPGDLFPMPVLGVPGWWPANGEAAFYADTGVFRPLPAPAANPQACTETGGVLQASPGAVGTSKTENCRLARSART